MNKSLEFCGEGSGDEQRKSLISVVVPTYNQSHYLPITLDSIWFQCYENLEIIIVNDGSTDDTVSILEAYCRDVDSQRVSFASNFDESTGNVERTWHSRYSRIGRDLKIIHHTGNQGLSVALNSGVSQAKGDYCTFIASDDMLLPSMITDLKNVIDETAADFAFSDLHIVDDSGRILRRFSFPDYSFEKSFCHWYLLGVGKLYRRSLHEEVGWYDEIIKPQDHDMFLRFAMHGAKFIHVPKVLVNLRDHDNGRQIDNHHPDNWGRLYQESAQLVVKAREFARKHNL